MTVVAQHPYKMMNRALVAFACAASLVASAAFAQGAPSAPVAAGPAPVPPTANYWAYVLSESSDQMFRVRFGPAGFVIEKTIEVGELPAEMEGPHGVVISRDGKTLHMTTEAGTPDGKYWKYDIPADTLLGPGIFLGNMPATIDVTPDGLYTFSANFNLHGDMVPSTISVVYTPTIEEVARIVTCTMPHGSRIDVSGMHHYSGCMMDDQLVEIDTRTFQVSRRFSVAKGKEGPLKTEMLMDMPGMPGMKMDPSKGPPIDPAQAGYTGDGMTHKMAGSQTCSPTWAQPNFDGTKVYVTCNKSDEILEIDVAKWALLRKFKSGRGPYNMDVTKDGKLLLVTLRPGNSFEVFDIATGTSRGQIKTSNTLANGIATTPDGKYAFVTSEGVGSQPGKVDVIDLTAMAKVGTVSVGQQSGGVAFWKMEPAR